MLDQAEDYGYSVVVRLQQHGFDGLSEGTVYPALTRLEKRGLLTSQLVASDSGPARKYYCPTTEGRHELTKAIEAWDELCANVTVAMSATGDETEETSLVVGKEPQ